MSEIKEDLRYTEDHEWAVELNFFAFSPVSYKSSTFGVIESTKSVSDLFAPIAGEVVEANTGAENEPDIINSSPYDLGWIIKIKPNKLEDLNSLLSSEDYKKLIDE